MSITRAESGDQAPAHQVVLPAPVVDWATVVRAGSPAREPTRGRLRELRKKGQLTDGITVTRHGERGLEGRANYYSVLSALAARCRQEGHDEDAAELERSASELEARFRERLQSFLGKHSLADLPDAEFSDELTTATAERLVAAWRRLRDELFAAAVVADVEGDVAYLRGTSPRGLPIEVDLPRVLLTRQSLEPGDAVWVFRRLLGDAVLIEILPATRVQLPCPDRVSSDFAGLTADAMWHGEPTGVGDDGLTDAERAGYASHYQETAAADLTADQTAELKRAAAGGRVPRRPLRPAG